MFVVLITKQHFYFDIFQNESGWGGAGLCGRNHINHRDMDFDVVWEAGMASESEEFVRRSGGRITTQLLA